MVSFEARLVSEKTQENMCERERCTQGFGWGERVKNTGTRGIQMSILPSVLICMGSYGLICLKNQLIFKETKKNDKNK